MVFCCLEEFIQEFLSSNILIKGFVALGAYHILTYIFSILSFFYQFVQPALDLQKRYGQNSWALVTGASDGIGKQFCYSLSKKGFNVVLVVRNKEKTQPIVDDLKKQFPSLNYRIVIADFSQSLQDVKFFKRVVDDVSDLDISLLVNNVGVDLSIYNKFYHTIPIKDVIQNIVVNTVPQTLLIHSFITKLLSRKQRSGIIDVGSYAGEQIFPMLELYSATKAYNNLLTRSLNLEFRSKLDILCVTPMTVESQLTRELIKKGALKYQIQSEQFTESSLSQIGRTSFSVGHYIHQIQAAIASRLPKSLSLSLAYKEMDKIKDCHIESQKKHN